MTIAWYVHHHGAGHRTRLLATVPHLGDEVVVLSSLPRPPEVQLPWVDLPLDLSSRPRDPDAHGTLHWAPQHHVGLRERMGVVSDVLRGERVEVLVADVSVEVALLARLHGVATVIVGQRGERTDAPHVLAHRQAERVVCPWAEATDLGGGAGRRCFVGAISRFDGRPAFAERRPGGDVLVLVGAGGHRIDPQRLAAAARATPGRTWHLAGALRVRDDLVIDHGPGADVESLLEACSVVVGTAGANVIAEVAAARRPYVCLPQARPFGEQDHNARALERLGVAVVREELPGPDAWPALLAAAEARDTSRWARLHDGGGGARLAAEIHAVRDAACAPA